MHKFQGSKYFRSLSRWAVREQKVIRTPEKIDTSQPEFCVKRPDLRYYKLFIVLFDYFSV